MKEGVSKPPHNLHYCVCIYSNSLRLYIYTSVEGSPYYLGLLLLLLCINYFMQDRKFIYKSSHNNNKLYSCCRFMFSSVPFVCIIMLYILHKKLHLYIICLAPHGSTRCNSM